MIITKYFRLYVLFLIVTPFLYFEEIGYDYSSIQDVHKRPEKRDIG